MFSFQFLPQDPSKVLVVSADSKVRILQGNDVVRRYKGILLLFLSTTIMFYSE